MDVLSWSICFFLVLGFCVLQESWHRYWTAIISSRRETRIGFCMCRPDAESEEERMRYKFGTAHYDEIRAEEQRYTETLPRAEDVLKETTFEEKPFYDKTSATDFLNSDVKDYKDSVVSIALFHGDKMLFACSGTALPRGREKLRVARFVTSARLITQFNKKRSKDDNLRIQVRFPDNRITDGFLGLYDGNIAIVSSLLLLSYVHPVDLDHSKEERKCEPTHLIAAGLATQQDSSLMVTGVNTLSIGQKRPRSPRGPTLVSVSCDITEAGLGGPIIAFRPGTKFEFLAGVIIGHDCKNKVAEYLPTKALRRRLEHFQILTAKAISFRGYSLPSGVHCVVPSGLWVSVQRFKSLGYPPPPPLVWEFNGELVNTFEEDFGQLLAWKGYPFDVPCGYGKDVWDELPKEVVMNVSQSIVSLASFKGDVRFFACTGLLIKWHGSQEIQDVVLTSASLVRTDGDKIAKNLRIEVFLPPEQRVEGKLELYHQNYNIAIVSVGSSLSAISPQDILRPLTEPKTPEVVVAIARNPGNGLLMASKGKMESRYKHCKLKRKSLKLSTCQITKAGIGGPLIDFDDGSFAGMNFYDGSKRTPFLPRSTILNVLERVIDLPSNRGLKGPMSLMNNVANKNWWPVPEAYWYHGELDEDKSVFRHVHVGKVYQ